MPIRVLPPMLANQIAAGEVVERPASVVKELVENCLDAGATRIEIELDKGGAQLIRIRDNGAGIPKEELALALSRHATSKLTSIEDLEAIASLGFRGEALASISSVSRLTLTSRPPEQAEAWQASAEGREMAVTVQPAAHPVGTTLEVRDLFFNTPARRKFLKSEKTEFSHVDELIRRLALSRFDVTFLLQHNGKTVRQYRAARSDAEQLRRVAAACGSVFLQRALRLDSEHMGLALSGWLLPPAAQTDTTPDLQYSYVNGRMMRDKLLTHAIRQGYLEALGVESAPSYVLYLQLDPAQVDVNVHPAKHEVRFHEARLVHDFIVRVVRDALLQGCEAARPGCEYDEHAGLPVSRGVETEADYGVIPMERTHQHGYQLRQGAAPSYGGGVSKVASTAMQALLAPALVDTQIPVTSSASVVDAWQLLALPHPRIALLGKASEFFLLDLALAEQRLLGRRLWQQWQEETMVSQPLLIPLLLPCDKKLREALGRTAAGLARLSVEWKWGSGDNLILYRVPVALRQSNLAVTFPLLLEKLAIEPFDEHQLQALCDWLAELSLASVADKLRHRSEASVLLATIEAECPELLQGSLLRPLSWQKEMEELLRGH